MGSVFLGRDPELDRAVAIKTVRHLDLDEPKRQTFLIRFKNEARAAARLSHPSIVAVYDVGEDEAVGPYLVFEYVAGTNLKEILRSRGPMQAKETVRMARQIASAIDVAHAAGVIHRDIKPDNILVSPEGQAKLADFGVARVPDAALTKEGQFLGTPCYAAPETLGSGKYGPHSDLFSFAAVLYEAITGRRAFPGDDAISVAHKVVHDDPLPPHEAATETSVPAAVSALMLRALAKEPRGRPPSASALVDELMAAYVEAGVLREDTTGLNLATADTVDASTDDSGGGRGWFVAVLLLAGAVGLGAVAMFTDWTQFSRNGNTETGGGDEDAAIDASSVLDAGDDASTLDAGLETDAGNEMADAGIDASEPDAGAGFDASWMSAFEREEAAKDSIDEARAALRSGNITDARVALDRARALDPGNEDIAELEAQLPPL